MIAEHRLHRLARFATADPNKRFDRLYREITRADFLMYAFEQIKDNKGSRTPGIDGRTKKYWSIQEAERVAAKLRNGAYQPEPVRRTYILKKSGKLRPLGIPTFEDRVVQSAIKLILEAVYEPIFRDCSHGFRTGRGCYTALDAIQDSPKVRIDWVVEGDIQGCFDNISHQILMRLLHKRIKDDRLLKLIAQFLKAGYFERDMWNPTKEGTPQGGIISPVLANIYLHEMDVYVEETLGANCRQNQTEQECYGRTSHDYKRLKSRISYLRDMLRGTRKMIGTEENVRAELRQLLKQRKHTPVMSAPIKPRVTYTRYADDFVIVLRSLPKTEAARIKEDLTRWVWENLRLILHPEKTAITHITKGFTFLSYKFLPYRNRGKGQPGIKMVIPYKSIATTIGHVRDICARHQDPESEVITSINRKLLGWMNYFACVTAPKKVFGKVLSTTWWTYGRYVAKKHHLRIGQAAGRWVGRTQPTPRYPNGGPKTWYATTKDASGKDKTVYLINYSPHRRRLCEMAKKACWTGYEDAQRLEATTAINQ